MARSLRRSVFETNSSSTHSLSMCSKNDFELWKKKKVLWDDGKSKFITMDDAIDVILKDIPDLNVKDKDDLSETMAEYDFYTYSRYMDDGCLESFTQKYTSEHGDEIVAFGKYGNDNC